MSAGIRIARETDAEGIQAIYAPIVSATPISFETTVPSIAEIRERIRNTLKQYPWIVSESNGQITGYAYASTYRTRPAYQWSAEVTVYVDETWRGQGLGKTLYESLFQILKKQGYCTLVGGITLPNPGSVRLHETLGFKHVGTFASLGFKLGQWHDVGFWQLQIQSMAEEPVSPTTFYETQTSLS